MDEYPSYSEKELCSFTPLTLYNLKLVIPAPLYFPEEDTDLIIDYLSSYIKTVNIHEINNTSLTICEVGIGPGTNLLFIAKAFHTILSHTSKLVNPPKIQFVGTDILPLAIKVSQYNASLNNLKKDVCFLHADLFTPIKSSPLNENKLPYYFSVVKEGFDLIIFNPPYLPAEETLSFTPNLEDYVWYGGKKGHETTLRFLKQAAPLLKPEGRIVLIASSQEPISEIEEYIEKYNMTYTIFNKLHLFFEELLVYEIRKKRAP